MQLTQFAEIIEMENPDLYCWLTGQQDVPDDISNPLLRTLCAPSLPTPPLVTGVRRRHHKRLSLCRRRGAQGVVRAEGDAAFDGRPR